MSVSRKRGLGMGLSALLGEPTATPEAAGGARLRDIPVEKLHPSPFQPRRHFPEEELEALARSIRERGVLQPLLARAAAGGDGFEIIAGERRWRAAQRAGLDTLPVMVREVPDGELIELALIENLQREDLNPIDEARAYRRLMKEFSYTQEALSTMLGRSRPHVANMLRLLNLPDELQALVVDGTLSAGHARALLGADRPEVAAREVIHRNLSVRETEALVDAGGREKRERRRAVRDPDLMALEDQVARQLGLRVRIRVGTRGGAVMIRFSEPRQLDLLVDRLISGG